VHADLFRNNVMFVGERLTGCFDFYFAGVDTWLFDLAVTVNDWCIDLASGRSTTAGCARCWRLPRGASVHRRRSAAWQPMLRAAALRFWLSRLYDFYRAARGRNADAARSHPFRTHPARAHRGIRTEPGRMNNMPARTGWDWLKRGMACSASSRPRSPPCCSPTSCSASDQRGALLGPMLAMVLIPSFSMAFMQACLMIENGERVTPSVLLTGFRKPVLAELCKVGLIYLGVSVLLTVLALLVTPNRCASRCCSRLDPKDVPPVHAWERAGRVRPAGPGCRRC
jgi:hypothetical protein